MTDVISETEREAMADDKPSSRRNEPTWLAFIRRMLGAAVVFEPVLASLLERDEQPAASRVELDATLARQARDAVAARYEGLTVDLGTAVSLVMWLALRTWAAADGKRVADLIDGYTPETEPGRGKRRAVKLDAGVKEAATHVAAVDFLGARGQETRVANLLLLVGLERLKALPKVADELTQPAASK